MKGETPGPLPSSVDRVREREDKKEEDTETVSIQKSTSEKGPPSSNENTDVKTGTRVTP